MAEPTQTNISQTTIPDYAKPYVERLLGIAQGTAFQTDEKGNVIGMQPYKAYPGERTADFQKLQNDAFAAAGKLGPAGQLQTATDLAERAGLGALNTSYQTGQFENQFQAPGSTAWHNQKVVGVISSFNPAFGKQAFTKTERNTLDFKNVEAFETDGTNVRTLGGKMTGGEWGEVIHGVAWLETRLEEDLYYLLTQQADRFSKVGYDVNGIASIYSTIASRLQKAVGTGLIDTNFTITTPSVELTEATDRANRLYKASFEARLIGAIKYMTITGTVTV